MALIKTVGIKDLKNNLSAWLRDVRRGTRLLVADRNVIVAELHEPLEPHPGDSLMLLGRTHRCPQLVPKGVVP